MVTKMRKLEMEKVLRERMARQALTKALAALDSKVPAMAGVYARDAARNFARMDEIDKETLTELLKPLGW